MRPRLPRTSCALALLVACHHAAGPSPHLRVTAEWPAHRAADVLANVTLPLERSVAALPHVVKLTSRTTAGRSELDLELEPGTRDDELVLARSAVDRLANVLPHSLATMPDVTFDDGKPLTWMTGTPDAIELAAYGVDRVEVCGTPARELRITVDAARLAEYGIALLDVKDAIARGSITEPRPDEIRHLLIKYEHGATVTLGDIASTSLVAAHPCEVATTDGAQAAASAHAIGDPSRLRALDVHLAPATPAVEYVTDRHPADAIAALRAIPGVAYAIARDHRLAIWLAPDADAQRTVSAIFDTGARLAQPPDAPVLAPDIVPVVDRDKAAQLGIAADAIDTQLAMCSGPVPVSTIFTQRDQYAVTLTVLDGCPALLAHSPLSAIVTLETRAEPSVIVRENQRTLSP